MELDAGKYTFLLGDLGNRTSINITDSSGKPVEEEFLIRFLTVAVCLPCLVRLRLSYLV